MVFVGPAFPQKISALIAFNDITYVAAGNNIYIVDRNIIVAVIEMKKESITTLAVFGDILVASGESSIYLFELRTNSKLFLLLFILFIVNILAIMHCEHFENKFIVDFFHPETYLNKIIICFSNGELIIFNIKSKKSIHTFTDFSGDTITCICGSPDPDIIALGFITGSVVFFELKKGLKLFSLRIDGSVSALSFRTDELAHLAVGSSRGDVQVFDLENHKLEHIISIHSKSVASLFFVPQQPLLVSTSGDNSIKEYLFESSEYRCLRQRSGHYKAPTNIRFYGEDSRFLVSAGSDRSVRFSSLFKDNQNFEFSQGSIQKIASKLKTSEEDVRLPEVSKIDIFETKTLKWDNMITSHSHQSYAKTWRFDRKTIGQHSLETTDKSIVSHISISSCGNFGILSTRTGFIDIFNLQSGIKRKNIKAFNEEKIIASFTDATNSWIISVSQEGKIKSFDFSKGFPFVAIELESPVLYATINKDTELIALACTDNIIRVIDYSSMRLVRVFNGHTAQIHDIVFSSDSKWLISCSLDRSIRTWDMASGNLADVLEVEKIPTAIALSRNLEFLASCHQDEISISIWSNRSLYTGDCNIIESAINWSNFKSEPSHSSTTEIQYSEYPASRWKNIYFLDRIRSNTKPIELSSKKRAALPFFLTQILEQDKMSMEIDFESNINPSSVTTDGEFSEFLSKFNSEGNELECFNFLKNLHPSKLDFEISCLPDESKIENIYFILKSLNYSVSSGHNFEIANSILALVLRHHEEYICAHNESFKAIMFNISENVKDKWQPLEQLMQSTICLVSFAREL